MIFKLLCLVSRLANLLPDRLIQWVGGSIGWIWFWILPIRRATVLSNLQLVYGSELTENEIWRLALRNYQHYGRTLLEVLQSLTWSTETFRRKVQLHGTENFEPFLKAGKGGYILTCHMGNWEFAVCSAAAAGLPIDVVVKRARQPAVEKVFQWYRARTGAKVHIEEGTARDILRSVSQGRFVGIVYDQFMGPPIGLPVSFFGKPAGTAVALALMTEKKDVPVIPNFSYRDENGKNHTVFGPPVKLPELSEDKDQRLYQKTQAFNDALEAMVRQHPDQWLWLHRRWKEYRGTPRWRRLAEATVCLSLLLCGVWARAEGAPTGIPLPADKPISVPKFKSFALESDGSKASNVTGSRSTLALPPASANLFDVIAPDKMPFEVGERLEIDLNWMALPAGRAVIEVRDGPPFLGRPTYELWGNALSSRLVDAVYHVDNTIESYVDKAGLVPYKFLLHMAESKQKKETRVNFDHTTKKAFYWAKRVSPSWGDQFINDRADDLVPAARDMFSALYYARALNFTLNKKESFAVYENGQNWTVDLTPVANEFVNTKVGAFQCWKILVNAHNNNILKPVGDVFMWLSDDSKKYLVKFDAKIKVGSVYGNLVSVREKQ